MITLHDSSWTGGRVPEKLYRMLALDHRSIQWMRSSRGYMFMREMGYNSTNESDGDESFFAYRREKRILVET
jgi:hypothetical protein